MILQALTLLAALIGLLLLAAGLPSFDVSTLGPEFLILVGIFSLFVCMCLLLVNYLREDIKATKAELRTLMGSKYKLGRAATASLGQDLYCVWLGGDRVLQMEVPYRKAVKYLLSIMQDGDTCFVYGEGLRTKKELEQIEYMLDAQLAHLAPQNTQLQPKRA